MQWKKTEWEKASCGYAKSVSIQYIFKEGNFYTNVDPLLENTEFIVECLEHKVVFSAPSSIWDCCTCSIIHYTSHSVATLLDTIG